MSKNITKIFAVILSLLMLVSLVGCGGATVKEASSKPDSGAPAQTQEAVKKEPVKITLWHIWSSDSDGNKAAFKKVEENFKAAKENSDIKLDVVAQTSGDAYFTKLKVALASNDGPDVYFSQGLGVIKPFVDGGRTLALDDLIAKHGTKDKVVGGGFGNFTFDGKIYALPTSMSIGTLYCNKELFEKNGVKLPVTYNDLLDAAKAFNAKGITPIVVGGGDQWPAMFYYDILGIRTAGVQASIDALNNKASFDQPAFIDAAKKLQDLAKANAFNKSLISMKWDEAQQNFVGEKSAMLFNGSWVAGLCEQDNSKVKGKIVAMKFPTVDGGAGKDTEFFGGALDSFAINPQTKNQEEAFRAAEWACSAMAKESYISGSGLPAWKIADVDTSKINPLIVQQAALIKDSTGFCAWWDTFLGGKKATAHTNLVLQLLSSKITPEEYAKQMQAQVNETK